MTTRRSIIICWVLLLVPTVLIAVAAFRLLGHEQERINRSQILSLTDRVTAIAETMTITVQEVEEALTRSLFELDPDTAAHTLKEWAAANPLVRNVFVWKSSAGLIWPKNTGEATAEEARFVQRYDALFAGRLSWKTGSGASREEPGAPGGTLPSTMAPSRVIQHASGQRLAVQEPFSKGRRKLLDLAESPDQAPSPYLKQEGVSVNAQSVRDSGWIPWFAENRLFILGWVQQSSGGPVYGVELELMTLLSRLILDLPRMTGQTTAYALIDGNGEILYQSGKFPEDQAAKPDVVIPVSPCLPHWQIRAYADHAPSAAGQGFMYVSGLLLAIFMVAIVLGGGLLTRQANREREAALQKTSFVSSVSHELKTPLTSIRMYAELLQSERVTAPDKMRHYLSVIVSESQRLTRLVNNVLDFGRLEQGKKRYRLQAVDLGSFVETLVETHSLRIRNAGLDPVVVPFQNTMMVLIDRDALEQVVLNLIDNAVKYAAQGKELTFILGDTPGKYCTLTIRDQGPGIPKNQHEAIFETFHRVDDSLTSSQPGSGLGLSIARRMLRDLGGDLVFEPNPGKGSSFIARIPKHDA